jgi:histidinol-phosphate aminotransferase
MADVSQELEAPLHVIRAAVRAQSPYRVGGVPDVAVKLNQNENPYDLPAPLKRALLEAFLQIPFNRYPTEQPDRLVQALAARLGHPPEGILVGNGSNELTHTLGLTLIDRGTPVVLPRPMFALYETVVRLFDGHLIPVAPRPDLHFDVAVLLEALDRHQPALTVLCTPNNPTGLALSFAEVEQIVAAAPGFVVVDEAYVEFQEQPSALTLLPHHPNLLVMRTFSKAFGLAGLRLGFLLGAPVVIQELLKARLPFMVDRLAETAALTLLDHQDLLDTHVATIKAECQRLMTALAALPGVHVLPSQANFVLFRTPLDPTVLFTRLAEAQVLVRGMGGYPELQGWLRVNAGTPAENQAFVEALKQLLFAANLS